MAEGVAWELGKLALLFAIGVVAGTLNVVAGGGSLLSLPALIFLGLPPTVANGTNRIAILLQNVGATWSFQRRGLVPWAWVRLAAPMVILGATLGTWAAISVGDLAFRRALAGVMVAAAGLMVWRPALPEVSADVPLPTGWRRMAALAGFLLMGAYGGFIQAGIGFLAIGLAVAMGIDLIRANAIKVATILVFTPITLAIFVWDGSVHWRLGVTLALGNFLGGLLGVRLQVLRGSRWVRGFVTVTVLAFALRLLW